MVLEVSCVLSKLNMSDGLDIEQGQARELNDAQMSVL